MWCGGVIERPSEKPATTWKQLHRERAHTAVSTIMQMQGKLGGVFCVGGLDLGALPESAQSASNTCRIFRATAGLLMINPTSRRFSSSSFRRLWLPTNALRAVADDGADVQAHRRPPLFDAGILALHVADDAHRARPWRRAP